MVLTEFKIIFDELSVDLDQAFFASVVDGGSAPAMPGRRTMYCSARNFYCSYGFLVRSLARLYQLFIKSQ
jgi:hypothetical protein